jgi:uncharacterized Tic20 family protein
MMALLSGLVGPLIELFSKIIGPLAGFLLGRKTAQDEAARTNQAAYAAVQTAYMRAIIATPKDIGGAVAELEKGKF